MMFLKFISIEISDIFWGLGGSQFCILFTVYLTAAMMPFPILTIIRHVNMMYQE